VATMLSLMYLRLICKGLGIAANGDKHLLARRILGSGWELPSNDEGILQDFLYHKTGKDDEQAIDESKSPVQDGVEEGDDKQVEEHPVERNEVQHVEEEERAEERNNVEEDKAPLPRPRERDILMPPLIRPDDVLRERNRERYRERKVNIPLEAGSLEEFLRATVASITTQTRITEEMLGKERDKRDDGDLLAEIRLVVYVMENMLIYEEYGTAI